MKTLDEMVDILAQKVAAGTGTVFFTGAGISTESGIPDFRSPGGIWTTYQPIMFDDFMSSRQARIEYWKQKTAFSELMKDVRPNPAHTAIVRLYNKGLVQAVITQNVDGMHQAAGMPEDRVIELHGNSLRVRCMSCRRISTLEDALNRIENGDPAPECTCGGYLKPDTISFGQAMPEHEVRTSIELARTCSCFIVVGSTLVVQPAASIPQYALEAGAFLAIVNLSETPLDGLAHLLIHEKAGTALDMLADTVEKLLP
ncbi:MAG: Sir2 family NAD-dependent protein deacetylase [Deltaproteobacteria bacterium]|nr:Sir2 family NAD-dependent protein deacetylase [Deltaproteobacteria bacterium]